MILRQPLALTGRDTAYNISVHVRGGGEGGQAVRLGIARALCESDPSLRPTLKAAGFDARRTGQGTQEGGPQAALGQYTKR